MAQTPCYVRCGSPGCKWQIALIDLSESEMQRLREAFPRALRRVSLPQSQRYRLRSFGSTSIVTR
jgi:hypothetical protein